MSKLVTQILQDLKTRYKNGEVSALVGAGFSKNVDKDLFPDWSQLLEDMVLFTYEDEINQSYLNYRHIEKNPKMQSKQAYQKDIIKEIIRRDGYLKVVDNYIRKKGFREAVEIYIEERTPKIVNFDDRGSKLKLLCAKISDDPVVIPDEKLNLHYLRCSWDNIFTTNYDRLLEYVAKHKILSWDFKPIINSSQLSFRSKKPIIKIHGSLADDTTKDFCFDNDHNKRYVICSDDYDSYPQKHEAFTQYMRISLLKGCFCLFGFSGDDQNFISWTKWVRDILVKTPDKNNGEENTHKVFLLSINEDFPSREKQLFYDNHKIAYIPLKNIVIKRELGVTDDETDLSVIYNAFFEYLLKDQIPQDDYNILWSRVAITHIDTTGKKYATTIEIDSSTLNRIIEIQSSQRFVKQTSFQEQILDELYRKEKMEEDELKIIVAALKDTQLLPGNYKSIAGDIEKLDPSVNNTTITNYKKLSIREQTILGKKAMISLDIPDFKDFSTYENLFYFAFNLDFSSLKDELQIWDATNTWLQRKATLLSMFNKDQSKSMLLDYIDTNPNYTEKYYTMDLLNYVNRTYPLQYPTEDFKYNGIDGIYDYFEFFIKSIKKRQKEKIIPLGDTRITYSVSKETTRLQSSLRLLQTLIDLGAPISLKNIFLINENDWYYAFRELYQYYPFATLFYSIQLTGKDILKRIGQEYAYSDSLFEQGIIPLLIEKLLTAYSNSDTPEFYKRGILYISSELFIAVPATKWQSLYMKIWQQFFIPDFSMINTRVEDLHDFIIAGLPFITSRYNKQIIQDCLKNAPLNKTMALNCLYYLKYKRLKTMNYENDAEYQFEVNNFIEKITSPEDFTILGNIYYSLNKLQKERISQRLIYFVEQNGETKFPTYTLKSLVYFAENSVKSKKTLKKILINHPNLFYNGISKEGSFSYREETLKITKISKSIDWTQKELFQLYKKLSDSIVQLAGSHWFEDSEDGFLLRDHVPLLQEMCKFLEMFKLRLKNKADFDHIYQLVYTSLIRKRKFTSIDEALISNEYEVVDNGIGELIENIKVIGFDANITSINLLIDRALFKRPESLLFAIEALWYLLDKHIQKMFDMFGHHLILLLETYRSNVYFDLSLDIPKVYSYLVKIASILQAKGAKSSAINYWIEIKNSKRFNI